MAKTSTAPMSVKIINGRLIIDMPIINPARLSASGKSCVVATTSGNVATDAEVDGRTVTLGLNAYYSAR